MKAEIYMKKCQELKVLFEKMMLANGGTLMVKVITPQNNFVAGCIYEMTYVSYCETVNDSFVTMKNPSNERGYNVIDIDCVYPTDEEVDKFNNLNK